LPKSLTKSLEGFAPFFVYCSFIEPLLSLSLSFLLLSLSPFLLSLLSFLLFDSKASFQEEEEAP
jgi:hypothetical protein